MKICRIIPPAAAPIGSSDLLYGLSGFFFGKHALHRLESELKAHFNAKHIFLVSSGKAALFLILRALRSLAPGKNQVVVPAYTCFSVPSAVVKAGLRLVPCDMNLSTFDFDEKHLRAAINEKTLCVLANHLFGIPADLEIARESARKVGAFVMEDAAQAMGGNRNGQLLGMLGDVGFFSLGRGKNLTCGSGGIIVTNSDSIGRAIQKEYDRLSGPGLVACMKEYLAAMILSIFIRPAFYWLPSGLPFLRLGETIFYRDFPVQKLSGMKAGLLRKWKTRIQKSNRIRRENARYFSNVLGLKGGSDFSTPCLRFPLILESKIARDRIFDAARAKGLGVSAMYPAPINEIAELAGLFGSKNFPNARIIADRILTLPIHELLTEKDKEKIGAFFRETACSGTYQSWGDSPIVWDLQTIN